MWDSIFVLIHHFDRPFKKKDIYYLINSRLHGLNKRTTILFHDINLNHKCSNCKDFQPWIMLKNSGEGLFLLKKFIEKTEPWISVNLQESIYEFNNINNDKYEAIFALINKINSRKILYNLVEDYQDVIFNSDITLKNQCLTCDNVFPWIIVNYNQKGLDFIRKLNEKFKPYITLKIQKTIYKHNIPKKILELEKWTRKEEVKFGNMKIEI